MAIFELANGTHRIPYSDGADTLVSKYHHARGGDAGTKRRYDLERHNDDHRQQRAIDRERLIF